MDGGHYGNDWSEDGPYGRAVTADSSATADTLRDKLLHTIYPTPEDGSAWALFARQSIRRILPVVLRYADAQVAAERERIAATIETQNCYGDPVCEAAYFHAAGIARGQL
jgi:hypothetical protein